MPIYYARKTLNREKEQNDNVGECIYQSENPETLINLSKPEKDGDIDWVRQDIEPTVSDNPKVQKQKLQPDEDSDFDDTLYDQ